MVRIQRGDHGIVAFLHGSLHTGKINRGTASLHSCVRFKIHGERECRRSQGECSCHSNCGSKQSSHKEKGNEIKGQVICIVDEDGERTLRGVGLTKIRIIFILSSHACPFNERKPLSQQRKTL